MAKLPWRTTAELEEEKVRNEEANNVPSTAELLDKINKLESKLDELKGS